MQPSFGAWLGAALVVTLGISLAERWDARVAWIAAILILMAAFFRYPTAMSEVRKLLNSS